MQRTVDFVANAFKSLEELSHPGATILQGFPRSIQLDGYSCGAKSVYCILQYYGIAISPEQTEQQLETSIEGTSIRDIKRVLKKHHLQYEIVHSLREIKKAIGKGFPVLVSLYDHWHYSVVLGYGRSHIFVMNPSVNPFSMGSVWCAVRREHFQEVWDKWSLIVRRENSQGE